MCVSDDSIVHTCAFHPLSWPRIAARTSGTNIDGLSAVNWKLHACTYYDDFTSESGAMLTSYCGNEQAAIASRPRLSNIWLFRETPEPDDQKLQPGKAQREARNFIFDPQRADKSEGANPEPR
jgi:hypothetical protein